MGRKPATPEAFAARPYTAKPVAYVHDEPAGEVWWCACGKSERQPYCDGSHRGGPVGPLVVTLDHPQRVAWCGCKRTQTPPYCDASQGCAEGA